eukprot:6471728-Amphidinium_carterae.1
MRTTSSQNANHLDANTLESNANTWSHVRKRRAKRTGVKVLLTCLLLLVLVLLLLLFHCFCGSLGSLNTTVTRQGTSAEASTFAEIPSSALSTLELAKRQSKPPTHGSSKLVSK